MLALGGEKVAVGVVNALTFDVEDCDPRGGGPSRQRELRANGCGCLGRPPCEALALVATRRNQLDLNPLILAHPVRSLLPSSHNACTRSQVFVLPLLRFFVCSNLLSTGGSNTV